MFSCKIDLNIQILILHIIIFFFAITFNRKQIKKKKLRIERRNYQKISKHLPLFIK